MKQTAVEWLIDKILSSPLEEATNVAHLKKFVNKLEIFEKAIEMEEQQTFDAQFRVISGIIPKGLIDAQKQKTIEEVFEWLTKNNYVTDLKETLIEQFKNQLQGQVL